MTAADLLLVVGTLLIVCSIAWVTFAEPVAVTMSGGAVLFLFGLWAFLAGGDE